MAKAQIIITSCSRRSLEIEQVKNYLRGNGYALAVDEWNVDPDADLILLSTCGFTKPAEDFGFETLRRVQAVKKPTAKVVFGGCIPQINPDRVMQEFNGPTFSPQSYAQLDEILGVERKFEQFKRPNLFENNGSSLITDARKVAEILKTYDGSISGIGYISRRLNNAVRRKLIRTKYANLYNPDTFYIQIEEGCSMHCSYCVIKTAIGPLRSRPVEVILGEFLSGLEAGYTHIQLMGDNAGSYGLDIGTNMGHLLDRILEIDRDFVLDLTDINPVYLPIIFETVKKLCSQAKLGSLYVPIQSANKRLLKLMARDCDMDRVRQMLIEIKQLAPPKFKLGTSLIVGFPSETVDELDETILFCEQAGFDWVWCHSFSARPETQATMLTGQISLEEIHRRTRLVKSRLGKKSLITTADDTSGSKTCQG
jgi:threonylcarbamoyladenosine tRNA methylthiotransferase MtaB